MGTYSGKATLSFMFISLTKRGSTLKGMNLSKFTPLRVPYKFYVLGQIGLSRDR